MARKKRSADSAPAASTRPVKKRKAAEAALSKIEEIKENEQLFSDDVEPQLQHDADADSEEDDDDGLGPAPPGFAKWKSSSKQASTAPLTQISKLNKDAWRYTQTVEIQHQNAFILKPLVVTDGVLKGCHVLVVESVQEASTAPFRFLDLPAEIRSLVYGLLLEESDPIEIDTYKPPHCPRRPVRASFTPGRYTKRPGLTWDQVLGKWGGQAPTAFTLLGVCRAIHNEAAPIAYGNNKFESAGYLNTHIFLAQIGNMRQHVRDITLNYGYNRGFGTIHEAHIYRELADAKYLRTFTLSHQAVCGSSYAYGHWRQTPESLVERMEPLLQVLYKAQQSGHSLHNVLDLIKITPHVKCWTCSANHKDYRHCQFSDTICKVTCKDEVKHCKKLEKNISKLVAKVLGIGAAEVSKRTDTLRGEALLEEALLDEDSLDEDSPNESSLAGSQLDDD